MRPRREHLIRLHARTRTARHGVVDRSVADNAARSRHDEHRLRRHCTGCFARRGRRPRRGACRPHHQHRRRSQRDHRRSATADESRQAAPRPGERSTKHAAANQAARIEALTRALEQRRAGWDASPISTARIYAELWPLIVDEDWILASPSNFSGAQRAVVGSQQALQLSWRTRGRRHGYGAPAAVGAALAARSRKQIVINVQTDGDSTMRRVCCGPHSIISCRCSR